MPGMARTLRSVGRVGPAERSDQGQRRIGACPPLLCLGNADTRGPLHRQRRLRRARAAPGPQSRRDPNGCHGVSENGVQARMIGRPTETWVNMACCSNIGGRHASLGTSGMEVAKGRFGGALASTTTANDAISLVGAGLGSIGQSTARGLPHPSKSPFLAGDQEGALTFNVFAIFSIFISGLGVTRYSTSRTRSGAACARTCRPLPISAPGSSRSGRG
jgi:hypothetical protein